MTVNILDNCFFMNTPLLPYAVGPKFNCNLHAADNLYDNTTGRPKIILCTQTFSIGHHSLDRDSNKYIIHGQNILPSMILF